MSAPTAEASPPAGLLTHRQILTIFAGLMIGMFLAALDQTIVATSIRTIADDLDGLSLQAWATTAYLITATITTPLYGKLSDIYGRKPLFLTAIGIFVLGSIACTFATSMYQLAAFRAIQGLGAGGLFSLALTIIGDIVAPRERAKYQGYFVAVFGTSSVLGPVAGGFFAGQAEILGITGWRWVFLINVPLGILALAVVTKVLNVPHTKRSHRIDWPGALALVVGLVPLLIVAEQGRVWGWDSGRSITCYVLGVLGILAFVLLERRIGDDALLPLRMFRNGVFSWGSIAGFVAGVGMFGALALLPLYLQIVKGSTPTEAGLQTLPLVLGIMSMSVFSGQMISRTGRYKIWPIIGLSLMIVGIGALSFIGVDTPYWQVALIMVVIGWGLGGNMQPLTLAVQNAAAPRDMGVATASATFFRQMGGTLGTAVFISVLFSVLGGQVADNFRAAAGTPAFQAALADPAVLSNPANAPILQGLQGGGGLSLDDSSFLATADPTLARPILEGFAGSMSIVFLGAAAVLIIGLFAVIMMKEVPLRTQSGVDARNSEDTTAAAAAAAEGGPDAVPADSDRPAPAQNGSAPVLTKAIPAAGGSTNGVSTNGSHSNGSHPNGSAPVGVLAEPRTERMAAPTGTDARDRLLAMLLPDPDRALTVVTTAERARDAVRHARTELEVRTAELDGAAEELVAQGLSPRQVQDLLGLTEDEGPLAARHGAHAAE
ncbi:MDR family MFS transporter [Pseudonocardia abyssalis]|uniref:MFS transporter n=1 Tax=Pseudonocardia abyssalis TaxID=2792008 RepID=A0ABS6UYJ4_9PSEU|nr:MDR family MFS transporter [Pseudonocardia abyssalis]MBW0117333.1 MFS transporter [Pseudonocardia abyssalis]MBW0137329.1 MFS transporter [Pseudonocardia abyssalis]